MTDVSSLIAWGVASMGFLVALFVCRSPRASSGAWGCITGVVLGAVLGSALTVLTVFLQSGCVELKYCTDRGDGNLEYLFHSLYATPLYMLLLAFGGQERRPQKS